METTKKILEDADKIAEITEEIKSGKTPDSGYIKDRNFVEYLKAIHNNSGTHKGDGYDVNVEFQVDYDADFLIYYMHNTRMISGNEIYYELTDMKDQWKECLLIVENIPFEKMSFEKWYEIFDEITR